jgi:tRNA (mo5U34)-methyltransferase
MPVYDIKVPYDPAELKAEVEKRDWFHTFELAPGIETKGHYHPDANWLFGLMGVAQDLKGKRGLDMGCADGLYGFELAARGARVTATDVFTPGYRNVEWLANLWQLPVEYRQTTLYTHKAEPYDVVLCLGVFYHLQYPLLGLHCLNQLCNDQLVLESEIRRGWSPTLKFLPGKELNRDPSNWWVPTKKCLIAMVESAGFKVERSIQHTHHRFMLSARKVRDVAPAFDWEAVNMANYGFKLY